MTVTATDQGLNPLSNSITVTVDVDRNANPPIFQNLPNNPTIQENLPTTQVFYTVTATDADTVVSTFSKNSLNTNKDILSWMFFKPVLNFLLCLTRVHSTTLHTPSLVMELQQSISKWMLRRVL